MNPCTAVLLTLIASPQLPNAAGQVLSRLSEGLAAARVGEWAMYQLDGGAVGVAYWRLAVVGKEKDGLGRDAFWLELDVGDHPSLVAPLQQLRLLVAKGEGLRASGISRLFVALGMERPAEVDAQALSRILAAAPARSDSTGIPGGRLRTGRASPLQTYAGTVEATPIEVLQRGVVVKRIWVSEVVPILQLARVELPGIDYRLEVREYGLDARGRMRVPDPTSPRIQLEPRGEPP